MDPEILFKVTVMKHLTRFIVLSFLLLSVAPLWANNSAVVLTYHRVGEDSVPSTNVRVEQFEEQLDYLEKNNFNVWPLVKILDAYDQGETLPPRTVAITLDDAYLSVYLEAFPRLQARNFPFTVFVSTDSVDKRHKGYMSWSQLKALKDAGVIIANHSKSHPYMVRYLEGEDEKSYRQRIRDEIELAQQRLVDELGVTPKLFAYPYGEYSEEVMAVVGALGYVGIGQHSGAIDEQSLRLALPRFPINEQYSNINDIALKLKTYPMQLESQSIIDPVWLGKQAPQLEILLGNSVTGLAELACYASGQGRMNIEWLDRKAGHFAIQAAKSLSGGRHRYTCTAPDKARRYQWFSQLWIVPPPDSVPSDRTE